MAISASNLTNNGSGTDASSYATASVTPASNNLILATVVSRTGTSVNPNQPTATGNGLTWVVVDTVVFDDTSSSRRRVTAFRAMGTPSSGAVTFSFGGQTQTSADWSIDQVSGTDTTGTNGSGAIVQHVTAFDDVGTNTTKSATLAAFASASNGTFASFGYGNPSQTATPTSGFTVLANNNGDAEAGSQVTTAWRSDNSTTVGITYGAGGEIGIIAMEIAVPAAVGGTTAHNLTLLGVGL